jgi:hypothetical protein
VSGNVNITEREVRGSDESSIDSASTVTRNIAGSGISTSSSGGEAGDMITTIGIDPEIEMNGVGSNVEMQERVGMPMLAAGRVKGGMGRVRETVDSMDMDMDLDQVVQSHRESKVRPNEDAAKESTADGRVC